jgi:hypothetical protein
MKRHFLPLLFAALASTLPMTAAEKDATPRKSDPRREVFVEDTTTDFELKSGVASGPSAKVVKFDLTGARAGTYTVLCFIDGRIWSRQTVELPSVFALNISGMTRGAHRVTLQAVDSSGRVGSVKHQIDVN